MNTKYLFQALKFACLPTLSVLTILFFGFFNILETINFISSTNGWAILLRIIMVIAEIVLVIIMYYKYRKEGELLDAKNGKIDSNRRNIHYGTDVYRIDNNWSSDDKYFIHETKDSDIVIIERVPKLKS